MSYKLSPSNQHVKVVDLMNEFSEKISSLMNKQVAKFRNVKVNCELFGLYTLKQQEVLDIKSFQTKYEILSPGTDVAELYKKFVEILDRKESEFQEKDSGWVLVKFLHVEVNFVKFNPLKASSYVKLPIEIIHKKAVINVMNFDEFCFGWAVASALVVPNGNPQRVASYPDFRTLCNWDGITFPMKLTDIGKFEDNNNISVNVYGLEEIIEQGTRKIEVVGPLYYTKKKQNTHINLLLIENNTGSQHYCWIKNFSRLVSTQLTTRHGAKYFCDSCLHYFRNEQLLQRHVTHDCNYVYTKLPTHNATIDTTGAITYDNVLKFNNFHKKMSVPFVIYADFESLLIPVHTAFPNPKDPFTVKTCKHEPYAFAYYIKSTENDEWSRLKLYRGVDAARTFINWLESDIHQIYSNHLKESKPMLPLTAPELVEYVTAQQCFICKKEFGNPGNPKVKDHSHLTGRYRGAAHSTCNLNYKIPNFIPIFFHNLSGYDAHLFIKQLALEKEEVDIIPQSKEKYITFSKRLLVDRTPKENGKMEDVYLRVRFLDSYRFLASSLDALAQTLADEQCTSLRKFYSDDQKFNLARVKGIFPYSYVDNYTKLSERCLPKKEDFYDTLREQHISKEDYQRATSTWSTFQCKSLGDYSDVYLSCDVLLLTDVFENFRVLCQKIYDLDPAQYITAPGLAWDAMLKHTQVELELLTDMDMYHFFKKGIRGGVSTCTKRKSLANNPYIPSFNSKNPTSYIMYLDSTNLYGYSMREYLPRTGFTWLSSEAVDSFNVLDIPDDAEEGYVLEVDLEYPDNLHDHHNDLPFCPKSICPPGSTSSQKKLIPNLNDKTAYIIHYRNLKQCLKHGLVLTYTHRILKFQQSPWLRSYIDLNTRLRNEVNTKFEKDFYKLMNNGVFGKTMENVDKRRNIRLLTHWENIGKRLGLEAYVAKPTFKQVTRFTEKLYAIELSKTAVVYNKPVYVGFTILDISKIVMYRFIYEVLRSKYEQNVKLLYTDTDSLIVEIQTPDVYEDMKMQINEYDTSNYKKNNRQNIPITTSVVGKMKDEFGGTAVHSFYGAGAKCYCVNVGDQIIKKLKVCENM
ncbi:hypothetical protein RN001_013401 [Aquatica leii]|uniref:DNA-directed DNA polymerase n=1 Tax=Aquatica leii TaxID=1421715 RepID=A0AAN7P4E2_9COLE|nr:hypothetical protein RN001_013401 [Aquatica leii]